MKTLIAERLIAFITIIVNKATEHLSIPERVQILNKLDFTDLTKILNDYTIQRNTK